MFIVHVPRPRSDKPLLLMRLIWFDARMKRHGSRMKRQGSRMNKVMGLGMNKVMGHE